MAAGDLIPEAVAAFLQAQTPPAWVEEACARIPELLLDHANCELKAASTAIGFIYRYPQRTRLAQRMSRLAREELRHFEQVRALLQEMDLPFERLSASRYAATLRDASSPDEPRRLLDVLIVGALIEARSCERFAVLVPHLPPPLDKFYAGLLRSEARHFEHYLELATLEFELDDSVIANRVAELQALEAELIRKPDPQFRFHSGVPEFASRR
ncbi:MAG: tRNA isopentenyl-2-thiomethyl-A-37 hydroxylase MiaE [Woeseia sp.]